MDSNQVESDPVPVLRVHPSINVASVIAVVFALWIALDDLPTQEWSNLTLVMIAGLCACVIAVFIHCGHAFVKAVNARRMGRVR